MSVVTNNSTMTSSLLVLQVNTQYGGSTPLQIACMNGYLDLVSFLIGKDADLETEVCTTSDVIIDNDVTLQDKDGNRVIHHSAIADQAGVIEMLVRAGCDINARNKRRQTALHIAVNRGHIWVVRTLLKLACHVSLQVSGYHDNHDTN